MKKNVGIQMIVFLLLLMPGCGSVELSSAPTPEVFEEEPLTEVTAPENTEITIAVVGDIMVHDAQIESAFNPFNSKYEFFDSFEAVAPYLKKADYVIGNLETTLAGKDLRYSGYPRFNAPETLAEALRDAGFTAVTTANNHALDKGIEGLHNTLDHLDLYGLKHTGTARSLEERLLPLVSSIKGIRLGILSYTYGTNGLPIPEGQDYLINLIDIDSVAEDLKRAEAAGADLTMVFLHFGNEYQQKPSPEQIELVDRIQSLGADLVVGSHPHVLQPAEFKKTGSKGRLVIYSVGNFISSQKGLDRQSSVIYYLTVIKSHDNNIYQDSVSFLPIYTYRYQEQGKFMVKVLPVEKVLLEQEPKWDLNLLKQAWASTVNILEGEGITVLSEVYNES